MAAQPCGGLGFSQPQVARDPSLKVRQQSVHTKRRGALVETGGDEPRRPGDPPPSKPADSGAGPPGAPPSDSLSIAGMVAALPRIEGVDRIAGIAGTEGIAGIRGP